MSCMSVRLRGSRAVWTPSATWTSVCLSVCLSLSDVRLREMWNESVPIQLAQCRLNHALDISTDII